MTKVEGLSPTHTEDPMSRPNIVLIMTDTQPTAFLGCYSGQDVRTPHLDSLAAGGVRFDRAYTSCPLCTPARAGLFTGMTPSRAGAYTNSQPLGENILTMGQRMQSGGYRTAFIGKWHLDAHDYFGNGTCPPGWEDGYWYDGKRYLLDLSPGDVELWRKKLMNPKELKKHDIKSEFTWAHRIADRSERFLAEQATDRPFLMVASFDEPHHPWTCPPEYLDRFRDFKLEIGPSAFDDLSGKPEHHLRWSEGWLGVQQPTGEYRHPLFLGCNSYVDSQIGRVAEAAQKWSEESGRDTWIIYTSDHGDHIGSHRLMSKGPSG
ncbi:MAG: sulfatase-like hydrolase/transferase, partial [Proteobacteria bacterium]|nr:sulfatase-like hydrolase/transferase [Pseudomonadota bacterium]